MKNKKSKVIAYLKQWLDFIEEHWLQIVLIGIVLVWLVIPVVKDVLHALTHW